MPGLKDSTIYTRVNVEGTQNVIAAAIRSNVPKLVFTSSAGVVFMGDDLENATEDTPYPTVAMDVYNETKAIAERLVVAANGRNGLLTVVLRPAGIFGYSSVFSYKRDRSLTSTTKTRRSPGITGLCYSLQDPEDAHSNRG
jgi:nucleoside-diphosphate-sugar epimerase